MSVIATWTGLLLTLAAGSASLVLRLEPQRWTRWVWEHGYRQDWLLFPPIYAVYGLASFGFLLLCIGSMSQETKVKESDSHGSARFAETKEVRAKGHGTSGVVLCMEAEAKLQPYLGPDGKQSWRVVRPADLVCTKWLHVLVEGPPGSGKDESIVLPTLLTDIWRSYVVLDPKGDAYERSAGYRHAYQHIFRFAPSDPSSHRCNPLLEVPVGTDREVLEAERIANVLVGSTAKEDMSSRIYLKSCETLMSCAIVHLLHHGATSARNLPGVLDLLTDRTKSQVQIATLIADKPPPGAEAAMDSLLLLAQDKKMLQGAFTTAIDVLGFCRIPTVRRAISGSDFRPSDLSMRDQPMTLYMVFPFKDADLLRPLARLMLNTLLAHHTEERKQDTVYLLNEAPSLGNIPAISRGIAELRSYGVQFVIFVQSEGQMFSHYGKEDAQTLLDTCRARVTLSASGKLATENMSAIIGKTTLAMKRTTKAVSRKSILETTETNTEGVGYNARELRTPDEVRAASGDVAYVALPELRVYAGKRPFRYAMPELLRRSQIPAPRTRRVA